MKENNETKVCKYCQTEISKKAKVCPNCKHKQGGIGCLGVILIVAFALIFIDTIQILFCITELIGTIILELPSDIQRANNIKFYRSKPHM